jgi:Family of unknown function (DUF6220)
MATSSPRSDAAPAGGVARAHRVLSLLFLAGAIVQFFLAGLAAFGGTQWDAHQAWGTVLTIVALVIVILAAVGRRQAVQASAILLGLMILQNILGAVGNDVPVLGALHPLNGLAVLGVAMLCASAARVRLGPPHGRAV